MRARYYQLDLGRFLSRDPLEVQPFNPVEINRYVYAANNPIHRLDPTGETSFTSRTLKISLITTPALPSLRELGRAVARPLILALVTLLVVQGAPDVAEDVPEVFREAVERAFEQLEAPLEENLERLEEPEPEPEPISVDLFPPRIPTPGPEDDIVYQFELPPPGSRKFKNGPSSSDFDGISVALTSLCLSPAQCLSAMFGRSPGQNDHYREADLGKLAGLGFLVTPNGGQPVPSGDGQTYPYPHASITHALQSYRDNGSPKWSNSVKNLFRTTFSQPQIVIPGE